MSYTPAGSSMEDVHRDESGALNTPRDPAEKVTQAYNTVGRHISIEDEENADEAESRNAGSQSWSLDGSFEQWQQQGKLFHSRSTPQLVQSGSKNPGLDVDSSRDERVIDLKRPRKPRSAVINVANDVLESFKRFSAAEKKRMQDSPIEVPFTPPLEADYKTRRPKSAMPEFEIDVLESFKKFSNDEKKRVRQKLQLDQEPGSGTSHSLSRIQPAPSPTMFADLGSALEMAGELHDRQIASLAPAPAVDYSPQEQSLSNGEVYPRPAVDDLDNGIPPKSRSQESERSGVEVLSAGGVRTRRSDRPSQGSIPPTPSTSKATAYYGQKQHDPSKVGGAIALVSIDAEKQEQQNQAPDAGFTTNCKLRRVLEDLEIEDCLQAFLEHGITDIWFPFSKQTLRTLLKTPADERKFLEAQEDFFHSDWPGSVDAKNPTPHRMFEDGEDIIPSERTLGEGGFAIVEQVTLPGQLVCVRKRIGRIKQFKAQKQLMVAFAREINIMRQVSHRHCVQFRGSYTDHDCLAIFLSPVADMDLATFLDLPNLNEEQLGTLRQGIGCLCNALLYLHNNKIRHEDLKPQNVLIHGQNILLTDFGFSLDFSEDSVSTTTGRPMHWTARYSAPETMNHEARNRATDIWGLGCILIEIISRLHGFRLSEMRQFWKDNGNGHPSYSLNTDAVVAWQEKITPRHRSNVKMALCWVLVLTMCNTNRFLRPTCQQLVDQLAHIEGFYPEEPQLFGSCCANPSKRRQNPLLSNHSGDRAHIEKPDLRLPPGYYFPSFVEGHVAVYFDANLRTFAFEPEDEFPYIKYEDCRKYFDFEDRGLDVLMHLINKAPVDLMSLSDFGLSSHKDAPLHCLISSVVCPIQEIISCSTIRNFTYDDDRFGAYMGSNSETRLIHLSLIPVCLARSPLAGQWFFRLSFRPYETSTDQSQLIHQIE